MRNIQEKFGVEIKFPIIADLSMAVAQAYGMIHPGAADTSAVRATFIIDPNGILRAMVYYPMSNGRSIAGFLRLVRRCRPPTPTRSPPRRLATGRQGHRTAAGHCRGSAGAGQSGVSTNVLTGISAKSL